ncbi:MAG: hypothetical protein ACFCUR_15240 [Rhodomicrobiaceae bacterium]
MAEKHYIDAPESGAEVGAYPALLSRVSWGAIFAGVACALAAHLVLSMIGVSVGFAVVDPAYEQDPLEGIGMAAGIWAAVSSLIALFAGGWVAGRLAGLPRDLTGALHGATVWAIVALTSTFLAFSGLSSALSGITTAVTQASQAVATTARTVIPDNLQNANLPIDTINSLVPDVDLERRINIFSAQDRQRQARTDIREEAREIVRQVLSRQEQQAAADAVGQTATNIVQSPENAGRELERLLDRLFAGSDAVIGEEDRKEILNILQNRLGVSEEEAEQIVNRWQEAYQTVATEAQQAWEQARQEATQAAQNATDVLAQASGWTALALILGLFAAAFGGIIGRPEEAALIWSSLPRKRR